MFLRLFIFLWYLAVVFGQFSFKDDCSDAPTEELRQICLRMRAKDRSARRKFENRRANRTHVGPPGTLPQQAMMLPLDGRGRVATSPYDCMTLHCLCPFFGGKIKKSGFCLLPSGKPLAGVIRKEYRLLSDAERRRFHEALKKLKNSGFYDHFSREHREVADGSGAHSGPGFLPWHREFLKRFEIALRLIDPHVSIPYWDSVMDGYLPDPRDSVLFSQNFMGVTDPDGNLITGPFAFWRTIEGNPAIKRQLGREGQLLTEHQVNMVLAQTNVEYVLAYIIPLRGCPFPPNFNAIEYSHANVHVWLGGDMFDQITSANDPIFYLHHSFIDNIWENWRNLRQPRAAYPPDLPQCASPLHFSHSQLAPYNLMLRDGLSNLYTDQLYKYAPRAVCTLERPSCGSKYLFCDTRIHPHCVSKIKLGGRCENFEMFDSCYQGRCIFGRCVPVEPPRPSTTQRPQTLSPERIPLIQKFSNCFNFHPCCDLWARKGECHKNEKFMQQFCMASCGVCQPAYNVSDTCTDRHVSCAQWASEGQCIKGNSVLFITENCRQSCGICGLSKCLDMPNKEVMVPVARSPSALRVRPKPLVNSRASKPRLMIPPKAKRLPSEFRKFSRRNRRKDEPLSKSKNTTIPQKKVSKTRRRPKALKKKKRLSRKTSRNA